MSNFVKIMTGALVLSAASTAFASAPKLMISGESNVAYLHLNEEDSFSDGRREDGIIMKNNLFFDVTAEAKNGLKYGGHIDLYANTSAADSGDDTQNAKEAYVFVEGDFGKVMAGSTYGTAKSMAISGSTFAAATGGFSGDSQYLYHLDNATSSYGVASAGFITDATLPSVDLKVNKGSTSNAISYITPDYMGVQAGVTYVPDTEVRGTTSAFKNVIEKSAGSKFHRDLIQGALTYKATFDGVGVKAALVGERAKAKDETLKDLKAWEVGVAVDYMGFTISGNYGSHDKSLMEKTFANAKKSEYYSLGLAYSYDAGRVSVSYLGSEKAQDNTTDFTNAAGEKNKFQAVSFGADYKLAEGLMPYLELTHFKAKDAVLKQDATKDYNDGWVFMVGTKVKF
jgi:predicted porin